MTVPDPTRLGDAAQPMPLSPLRQAIETGVLVVGLGVGGDPVTVRLGGFGHVLVAAPTGGGGTATLRLLAAQALRMGGEVSFVVTGPDTHGWALDVDGVEHWRTVGEFSRGLRGVAGEVERRWAELNVIDPDGERLGTDLFRPRFVVIDNLAAFMRHLRGHPDDVGAGSGAALRDVVRLGQAVGVHVVASTAVPLGDPGLLGCFDTRLVAPGLSAQMWQVFAGHVPVPLSGSTDPGWMHLIGGAQTVELRVVYLSGAAARAWGTGGEL